MPIKGLTKDVKLPILGQLRKGAPKPERGNAPGRDLEYFRFTSDDDDIVAAFHEHYGDQPVRLDVSLPYATVDGNLDAWMEEYGSGSIKRRCDGETCVLHQLRDGSFSDEPTPCQQHSNPKCQCKQTGRLSVILPALARMGTITVLTTSIHDIRNLYGALTHYYDLASRAGRDLRGIPFLLRRRVQNISTPRGNGKRVRTAKSLLIIEPQPEWVKVRMLEQTQHALLASPTMGREQMLITAPGEATDPETGEVYEVAEAEVLEAEVVPPMPTVLKELQTSASDFGFAHTDRDLRLRFTALLLGRDVPSYKGVKDDEAQYCIRAFDYMADLLRKNGFEPVRFAREAVASAWPLSDETSAANQLSEYIRISRELETQGTLL
ncbi:MAG: hypothetical protein RhofKO_29240 [Rhodothermales bacterium]